MALQFIPEAWLRRVVHLLRHGTSREIRKTARFSQEFQRSFPSDVVDNAFPYLIRFLESKNPLGCPVQMHYPSGETWEFWFSYKSQKTYGKILLTTDLQRIILHSAHLPEKTHLRCETEPSL